MIKVQSINSNSVANIEDVPRVSVVIPVYGTEPYLRRCLDSVVNQTLRDIEIICVNDCSPDNSLAILREYEKCDSRVKLIDFVQNQGESAARNAAMQVAQGEYIGFVDSDDYVDLDFYEKLYALAVKNGADIAKGDVIVIGCNGKSSRISINDRVRTHKAHFKSEFWAAIYKTALIRCNALAFPKGVTNGPDIVFLIKAVYYANTVSTTDEVAYWYIRREISASPRQLSRDRAFTLLNSYELVINFINSVKSVDKGYDIVFANCTNSLVQLSLRNREPDFLSTLAEKTVAVYRTCKRKQQFLSIGQCIGKEFIINEDVDALLDFFRKHASQITLLASELRSRKYKSCHS
jgi:glycosyltransferase involved in cell wall biosynthesis